MCVCKDSLQTSDQMYGNLLGKATYVLLTGKSPEYTIAISHIIIIILIDNTIH